ncbi:MAG: DUF4198 domain-containing protein [Planctomycetota bacterium]|nr:MAG: DUF4198 domain-containing protein [Planctomycetota bacterium]
MKSCLLLLLSVALPCSAVGQELWIQPPLEKEAKSDADSKDGGPSKWRAYAGQRLGKADLPMSARGFRSRMVGPDATPRPLRWQNRQDRLSTAMTENFGGAFLVQGHRPFEERAIGRSELLAMARDWGSSLEVLQQIADLEADDQPLFRSRAFAKALVGWRGSRRGPAGTWRSSFNLEIIPRKNPLTYHAGEILEVQVVYRVQPLADAAVRWYHPQSKAAGTSWTNRRGRAWIPLPESGWLLIGVGVLEPPQAGVPNDEEGDDLPVDRWRSEATSFSFHVAKEPPPKPVTPPAPEGEAVEEGKAILDSSTESGGSVSQAWDSPDTDD